MSGADQYMAQQAVSGILVVGADFKRFQESPYGYNNLVCLLVFDETAVHRDNAVAFLLINTGNGIMPSVLPEGRMLIG